MRVLVVSKSLCGYVSNTDPHVTITHTHIRTHPHTLTTTHKRNPNGFCL